ncbi:MAG: hypothetical protein SGI73_13875 [Chloroflexota bacterium]|nr:hypothetical protein [Chloroflexota bacterium]
MSDPASVDIPLPKKLYVPKDPFGLGGASDPLFGKLGDTLPKDLLAPKPTPSHRESKPKWKKQTLRLDDNHTWNAPDGYVILMLDRGAVRFNIPQGWHTDWKDNHLQLYDHKPPDDTAGISVTIFHLPPHVNWEQLPLKQLLEQSTNEERDVEKHGEELWRSEVLTITRPDIELCWMEVKFIDPKEKRPAFGRHAVARGFDVAALITFSLWEEDVERFAPVWAEVLRSIELGRYIDDPTKGDTLH